MDQVKCRLEIPNVEGLPNAEMSVGRHAVLSCEGDWNKAFDFTKASLQIPENQKNLVKIFKVEARSASAFDIDITMYFGGTGEFPEMTLTDGTNSISLGSQKFQVQSVLEKTQPGQPPQKPYGYLFPIPLVWPTLYFVLFFAALAMALAALLLRLRQAARFSRMIADLKVHESAVAPDLQFYKTLRAAEKDEYPIDVLEKALRLYVLRVFEAPMFVLSNREINRFFKQRKVQFKSERVQIEKLLSEFEHVQKNKTALSFADKQELVGKMYRFVGGRP